MHFGKVVQKYICFHRKAAYLPDRENVYFLIIELEENPLSYVQQVKKPP
jgi:hypothetical protein